MEKSLEQIEPIDISIVTYNSARWLPSFVESLIQQHYPLTALRLLIRDNGSSDDSWDLLQALLPKLQRLFADVSCDRGANIGFGTGHNLNFKRTQARFVLVTNVDLRFEADTLHALVDAARGSDAAVASWECRQKPYEHPKNYHPATLETAWSSSACTLFRTEALRQVGGYEERIFLYGEDVELSYRLRDKGWRLHYVPKATVWHYTYEHAGQVKKAQFLGSTLANALIRCRYGALLDVVQGALMMVALFFYPQQFAGQRWAVGRNAVKFLWLAPVFLLSRKQSNERFPFWGWDYEFIRDGAFHAYPEQPLQWEPLVSILVRTTPGRSARLKEAVASVRNQTYRNVELVVVEDGANSAEQYVNSVREDGTLASVVYQSLPKVGRCLAGNAALAASHGELLCFLDDDDLLYADHIEVLVQALAQEPTLGGVYGLAFQVDTQVISVEDWKYVEKLHSVIHRQPFERAILWHHNYIPIQCVVFRRELYEAYGGFDSELDNLEDWNLWVRYTQTRSLKLVEKVTSLYRVPHEPSEMLQRQHSLDTYYKAATAKNDLVRVETKPSEILRMADTLSRPIAPVAVPSSRFRVWVLSLPGARRIIRPLLQLARSLRS
jgi:GT2 family glycosyltransferase